MKKMTLAVASLAALSAEVGAFQFDTSEDWSIRWDNTLKYNLMSRVAKQDKDVYAGANGALADDSDLAFDRSNGGIVSNRVDLLSELDIIWRDNFGARFSVAGWQDFAYSDSDHPGINSQTGLNTWSGISYDSGEFSDEAEQLHQTGGELLDAFLFWNFSMGDDIEGNLRAGRHTIYWGQSLLLTGAVHGVGGAMAPIDLAKGFSVPGSEAKELFMPTNKLSTLIQLTDDLTLNAYYSMEWEGYRVPEAGSFFSPGEVLTEDTEFLFLAGGVPGVAPRIGLSGQEDEDGGSGEWGLNLQYYWEKADVEIGLYYLNYQDKNFHGLTGGIDFGQFAQVQAAAGDPNFGALVSAWTNAVAAGLTTPPNAPSVLAADALGVGQFKWSYKDDIDLYGFSLSKEIAGVSWGFELVKRENAPLAPALGAALQQFVNIPDLVQTFPGVPAPIDFAASDAEDYIGAVGDSWHMIINALGVLNDNGIWEGGSYIVEASFSMLDDVTQGESLMNADIGKHRVVSNIGMVFKPTWFQVFPGVDMNMPMSVSYTPDGESSPIALGGNETLGNGSIGLEFEINQQWNIATKYNFFFGSSDNGLLGLVKDRDNVSLTVKRTF